MNHLSASEACEAHRKRITDRFASILRQRFEDLDEGHTLQAAEHAASAYIGYPEDWIRRPETALLNYPKLVVCECGKRLVASHRIDHRPCPMSRRFPSWRPALRSHSHWSCGQPN